ncbi:PREDICTED: low-density lipoprotein receptor-related protein 1B-like [Cariama cristata]|uniref:low-density lipoprotein receptor-related protein 1B-like n=1 Tax=Cariama cristata TaxID=54380 RepID=UPI00052050A4|nr:PREDICTED: low-density lipoprotein receptor-related protein 1B-like [Cariama cristata]
MGDSRTMEGADWCGYCRLLDACDVQPTGQAHSVRGQLPKAASLTISVQLRDLKKLLKMMMAVKVNGRASPVQIVQQFYTPSYDIAANEGREIVQRSIAIIVPLVLLVTLITTLVIGLFLCKRKRRTKTIRRQPIINGGINVEIGNPSYNMYEVGHDHSEGGLLASDFTVTAEKARYIGGGPTAFKLPHTAPSVYLNSDLKGPLSTGPTNYANPVYAKLYMDGQNCRNSLASVDERRELLPKKIDIGIRETVA